MPQNRQMFSPASMSLLLGVSSSQHKILFVLASCCYVPFLSSQYFTHFKQTLSVFELNSNISKICFIQRNFPQLQMRSMRFIMNSQVIEQIQTTCLSPYIRFNLKAHENSVPSCKVFYAQADFQKLKNQITRIIFYISMSLTLVL